MSLLFFCLIKQTKCLFYTSSLNNCVIYTDGVVLEDGFFNANTNFEMKEFCIFTSSEKVFLKIEEFYEKYDVNARRKILKCKNHETSSKKCTVTKSTIFTTSKKKESICFYVLKISIGVSTASFCKSVQISFNAKDRTEVFDVIINLIYTIKYITGTFSEYFERGNIKSSILHHNEQRFDIYLSLLNCNPITNFAIFYKRSVMFLDSFNAKFKILCYSHCNSSLNLGFFMNSFMPFEFEDLTYLVLFSFDLKNVRPIIFELQEFKITEIIVPTWELLNKKIFETTKRRVIKSKRPMQENVTYNVNSHQNKPTDELIPIIKSNQNCTFEDKKTNYLWFNVFCGLLLLLSSILIWLMFYYWNKENKNRN